ncbi:MAG: hypothetical protein ACRD3W_15205 [Terriglobales bacterium]
MNSLKIASLATLCVLLGTSAAQARPGWRFDQHHPRRGEVLNRDANLNNRINANRGDLHGHYGQLKREDQAIRHQEQRDARMNGGHITKGEQKQINREENHVNRQIHHDK